MIDENSTVTLHFSLALENGQMIDSTFEKTAPTMTMGDGSLLHGFEQRLMGLQVGDKKEFLIEPKDAFGAHNPMNVQYFKTEEFDPEIVEVGMIVSFIDAGQHELPGVISRFDEEQVEVDFNHPLAGKNLLFTVEIIHVQ